MNRSILILAKFLWHDFYVYSKQIKNYIINYSIIYPTLFSISYGYIIPNTLLYSNKLASTGVVLTGNLAFIFLILSSTLNLLLLLDFDGDRYIDYQITLIKPRLVIIEKIIFSTIFSFLVSLLFMTSCKIILRENFVTTNLSIFKFLTIFILGSLTCACYAIMSICVLKNTSRVGTWWRRVNNPILILGGNWVPWFAIYKVSQLLSYIVLLNPMIYITEGVRGAIFGNSIYIPFQYCAVILFIFSIIFTCIALYFFKKKTDHI